MRGTASNPIRHRRLAAVALLFVVAVCCGHSESFASCGDYLIHGYLDHGGLSQAAMSDSDQRSAPEQGGYLEPRTGLLERSGRSITPPLPEPSSPCANGHCQALPMWPPVNHPSRLILWEQMATVDGLLGVDCSRGSAKWENPTDGLLPTECYLSVAVPPPRAAL